MSIPNELGRTEDAIEMYRKAVELDSDDPITRAAFREALAMQGKYADAAYEGAAAIQLFSAYISNSRLASASGKTLTAHKIITQQETAHYCSQIEQIDESIETYEDIVNCLDTFDTTSEGWNMIAQAMSLYFRTLVDNKKWERAALLLTRLTRHTNRFSEAFVMIYQGVAGNEDLLLQLGYHLEDQHVLTDFMDNVLASAARQQSESAVVIVVEKLAYMLLRLFKTRTTEAISMFEAVADDSHAAGPLKDRAETELARHFLTQMFRARNEDRWQKVAESVDGLIKLATANEQDAKNSLSQTRDCCIILAALYQVNDLHTRAMQCVRSNVKVGIAYLSDTNPENDSMAWWPLCDSLLAVGDETRAVAAVNMIRSGHFMAIEQSEERPEVADSDGLATNDKRVGASDRPPGSEGEIARPPPPEAQAYVSKTLSAVSNPSDHKQLRSAQS